MERRRQYIACFLVAVSILVLMAAVFPHHHHGSQFCVSAHCEVCMQDDCTCTQHHCSGEEDCEHSCTFACLTQFHYLSPDWHDHVTADCDFFTVLLPLLSEALYSFDPDQSIDYETCYQEKLHALRLVSSLGLRAPPVMILA